LIVGILIGPRLLNIVPSAIIGVSDFASYFVLGIIAFSLGANFTIPHLKAGGKAVIWISIAEAGLAWVIVTAVMIVYYQIIHFPVHPALILGAAASATAPAATVMIIREYRASGPVTEMLLRVVAIDDAWCLIFSAVAITTASALHSNVFKIGIFAYDVMEIIAALMLGGLLGIAFRVAARFVVMKEELLVITIGSILLGAGLALKFGLSPLLTNLAFGVYVANFVTESELYFTTLRQVDMMFFLAFFVLVGANLELDLIPKVGFMGLLYIVFRVIGKSLGVKLGSWIAQADPKISRYLAWGLVPQAGVALGVALSAKMLYPKYGEIIFTTITATTVIYELVGPLVAKYGLKKAGEI
jgi:Kef-type K+ transport system membrane component KefB